MTAGQKLDEAKLTYVSALAHELRKRFPDLLLIACCGIADKESLRELKRAGIDVYNHNLETAESFYPTICTTMDWRARYATCEHAKSEGLMLCSGGIFGLGERESERESLLESLATLQPCSVPINFFTPHAALPIQQPVVSRSEAESCIRLAREKLPQSMLMIAGGREAVLGEDHDALFDWGVNAVVIGHYLTTEGRSPADDLAMLERLGLQAARRQDLLLKSPEEF